MEKQHTEQDINLFFERFKKLPEYYNIEKVQQLINNPVAKAMRRINFKYKPFKFMIMTSIFIVGISSFLLWLNPNVEIKQPKQEVLQTKQFNAKTSKSDSSGIETKTSVNQTNQPNNLVNQTVFETETTENKIAENNAESIFQENMDLISDKEFSKVIWLEDTVIDGEKFIITLTDKELENIGFMIDGTGLYYYNQYNGQISSFLCHKESNFWTIHGIATSVLKRNKKEQYSNYDYYPVAYTNILINNSQFAKEIFALMNDTLMPVLVKSKQSKNNEDIIFWFKITDNLFNYLPERYQKFKEDYHEIIENKRKLKNIDFVQFQIENIFNTIQFIELNKEQYANLGFDFKPDNIQIMTKGWNLFLSKQKFGVESIGIFKWREPEIKLTFLSDRIGLQRIQWSIIGDDKDKFNKDYFISKIQNLIPILMKQSAFPDILNEDQVFWFEPSEALFKALPEHIGKQLRMEYNYISAETDEQRKELTTNCTYFEACKSTLKVEKCKLYPNPANTYAIIEFSMPEPATGTISLANISGTRLKILVPTTSFTIVNNSFKFDLTGIIPGIYLVLIKTDKGFKTQRLIISK